MWSYYHHFFVYKSADLQKTVKNGKMTAVQTCVCIPNYDFRILRCSIL